MADTLAALLEIYRSQYRRTGSGLREERWVKDVAAALDGFAAQVRGLDDLLGAVDAGRFDNLAAFKRASGGAIALIKAALDSLEMTVRRAQGADREKVVRAATLDQPRLRKKAEQQKQADDALEENLAALVRQAESAVQRDIGELKPAPIAPPPLPPTPPPPTPPTPIPLEPLLDPAMRRLEDAMAHPAPTHDGELVDGQLIDSGAAEPMPLS